MNFLNEIAGRYPNAISLAAHHDDRERRGHHPPISPAVIGGVLAESG